MAAFSPQAVDEGWVLDEPVAPASASATRTLTLVAAGGGAATAALPAASTDRSVDDGWCVDDGWALDEPAPVPTPAPVTAPAPVLVLVADAAEDYPEAAPEIACDGWFVESDERAPTMELSAAEAAFFDDGESLAARAAQVDGFDDLAPGPAPSFWQRLWRRSR